VALTAFAAERRAAAWLMLTPDVQQSIDICWPVGPQQQTRSNSVLQQMGQTDGRPTVANTLLCLLCGQCQ